MPQCPVAMGVKMFGWLCTAQLWVHSPLACDWCQAKLVQSEVYLLETKSTGLGQVRGQLLKSCFSQLAAVFCHLFNRSLSEHSILSLWKPSIICPAAKKKEPTCDNDYRPGALTSVLIKGLFSASFRRRSVCMLTPFSFHTNWCVDDAVLTMLHGAYSHSSDWCLWTSRAPLTLSNVTWWDVSYRYFRWRLTRSWSSGSSLSWLIDNRGPESMVTSVHPSLFPQEPHRALSAHLSCRPIPRLSVNNQLIERVESYRDLNNNWSQTHLPTKRGNHLFQMLAASLLLEKALQAPRSSVTPVSLLQMPQWIRNHLERISLFRFTIDMIFFSE